MSAIAEQLQRFARPFDQGPSRRELVISAFFGTWAITGLFLDGWAHEANKPETFFSPWHGVLYSAFIVGTAYSMIDTFIKRSRGQAVEKMDPAILGGLLLFGAAGVGDMVWHQIFGIEVDVEALISPSHLLLMIAGLVLLGGSLRGVWRTSAAAQSMREFFPTLLIYTLIVALIAFFTMYLSAFRLSELVPSPGEMNEVYGMASIFWTNILLIGAALLLVRRWTTPAGTFTFLFGVVAIATTGLRAFEHAPLALAAVAGGVTLDVLVRRGASVRTISATVPAVMWSSFLAVYHAVYGVGWSPELWSGAIVLSVLLGLALGLLVFPPAHQDARQLVAQERMDAAVS